MEIVVRLSRGPTLVPAMTLARRRRLFTAPRPALLLPILMPVSSLPPPVWPRRKGPFLFLLLLLLLLALLMLLLPLLLVLPFGCNDGIEAGKALDAAADDDSGGCSPSIFSLQDVCLSV